MMNCHDISFTEYSAGKYIMHIDSDRHFVISKDKKILFDETLLHLSEVEKEDFYSQLLKITNRKIENKIGMQNYQWKYNLISGRNMSIVSYPFAWLFNQFVFTAVFSLSIVFCSYSLFFRRDGLGSDTFAFDFSLLCILLMCVCHELGHASACKYYNVPIGHIGIGVAAYRPVMFANVNGAWYLPRRQRLMVNIGGVYFQILFTAVMILIALNVKSASLFYVCKIMFISAFLQFLPFYRMDGYWFISDLMGEPNLYEDSFKLLQGYFKNRKIRYNRRQKLLMSYFVGFELLVLFSLIVFFITNFSVIVGLPHRLWIVFESLLMDSRTNSNLLDFHTCWVMLVLYFVYKRLLINIIRRLFAKGAARKVSEIAP